MKKSRRCGLGTTICRGLLFVLLAVCLHTAPKAYALGGDLADVNLNVNSVWASGSLDEKAGSEIDNYRRVRTKDCFVLGYDKYEVSLTNKNFTICAFYYDSNMSFLSFENLYDGAVINRNDSAKYVRFYYKHNTSEKSMSPGQWGRYIGSSLGVSFKAVVQHESNVSISEEVVEVEQHELFDDIQISSSAGLISGDIDVKTGAVVENRRRMITKTLLPVYDQTLEISINKADFKVGVYEYDGNEKYIRMTVASDGSEVAVTPETRYVRFCLYRTYSEKSLSPGQWGRIFGSGLSLSIASEAESVEDAKDDDVYVSAPAPAPAPVAEPEPEPKQATTPHDELYNEMKQMLMTGDRSVHDISKYGMDIYEVRAIEKELRQGECYYYFANSCVMFLSNFGLKNNICSSMQFEGMDADFLNRYNRMMSALNEIKSMTTSQMTDLDKVILAHEYIIQHAYYEKTSLTRGCTGGILGDGHGLCAGYADAFNDALKYLGIEARYVSSNDMNHAWSLVKIDGQYYHVDCTWDNTTEEDKGYLGHNYLLASDTRFAKSIPSRHYNWSVSEEDVAGGVKVPATSTKWDNWFVHDVKGLMVYANGYWYYADGKNIKKSDAYGNSMSTVLTEAANVSIIGVSQGKLQYKVNGVVKSISVK